MDPSYHLNWGRDCHPQPEAGVYGWQDARHVAENHQVSYGRTFRHRHQHISSSPSSSGWSEGVATPLTDNTQSSPEGNEWPAQVFPQGDVTQQDYSGLSGELLTAVESQDLLPPSEDDSWFDESPGYEIRIEGLQCSSQLSVLTQPQLEWWPSTGTDTKNGEMDMQESCASDQTILPAQPYVDPRTRLVENIRVFNYPSGPQTRNRQVISPAVASSSHDPYQLPQLPDYSHDMNQHSWPSDNFEEGSSWVSLTPPSQVGGQWSSLASPVAPNPQSEMFDTGQAPYYEEGATHFTVASGFEAFRNNPFSLESAPYHCVQNGELPPSIAIRQDTPPVYIPDPLYVQNNSKYLYVPDPPRGSSRPMNDGRSGQVPGPKQAASRRRSRSKEDKDHTKLAHGDACIRCRYQKAQCKRDPDDPEGPCLTCKKLKSPTATNLGCLKYTVTEASVYRQQDRPYQGFSKRWQSMDPVDITEWASLQTKIIYVTQVFLDAPLQLEVQEFVPKDGDMLVERWLDGHTMRDHDVPAYAMTHLQSKKKTYEEFIDQNIQVYLNGVIDHRQLDVLFVSTYRECLYQLARKQGTDEARLLGNMLRLWVSCRMTSHPHHIVGPESLGGERIHNSKSPQDGKNPMPPIMIAQQELIMYTYFLRPLSHDVLKDLSILIYANKREYWYTIYLVIFMLLHSCSMVIRRNEEYARQLNLETRYKDASAIERHHGGAQAILAHFHYINKGAKPFADALHPHKYHHFVTDIGLSGDQAKFIRKTALRVQDLEQNLKTVRANRDYGHDLYWIAQLFDPDWHPHKFPG